MIKFKVEINPFTRKAVINAKIGVIQYTHIMYYEELDEWGSFEFDNKTFDIHFHYDTKFSVSIYLVENDKVDFSKHFKVSLKFKMED